MAGFLANLQQNPLFMAGMMGLSQSLGGNPAGPGMALGFQSAMSARDAAERRELQRLQFQQLQQAHQAKMAQQQALKGFLASDQGQGLLSQAGLPPNIPPQMAMPLIQQALKPRTPGSVEQTIQALMARGYTEEQAIEAALKRGSTTIQMPGPGTPNYAAEALAEADVGRVTSALEEADTAQGQLHRNLRMQSQFWDIVAQGGDTGAYTPIKMALTRYLRPFASDEQVARLASQEVFNVQAGDMVMSRIQETKGAVSDKEMAYFAEISPGLGKEPFSNYALMRYVQEDLELKVGKARAQEQWLRDNGSLAGFDEHWQRTAPELTPVSQLREEFNAQYNQLTQPAPAPAPVPTAPVAQPIAPGAPQYDDLPPQTPPKQTQRPPPVPIPKDEYDSMPPWLQLYHTPEGVR